MTPTPRAPAPSRSLMRETFPLQETFLNPCLTMPTPDQPTPPLDDQQPTEPILQFFEFAHLPERLQAASRPFHATAWWVVQNLPRNAERSTALRKLLEGKDAAVRALLAQ